MQLKLVYLKRQCAINPISKPNKNLFRVILWQDRPLGMDGPLAQAHKTHGLIQPLAHLTKTGLA